MSYSSQATKKIPTDNFSKRTVAIDSIAIQCCCDTITLSDLGSIYKNPSSKSSAHYGIDTDGNIAVFVNEEYASWSISNTAINNRCISIMMIPSSNQSPYPCSQRACNSLVNLLVDICIRNNINSLKWKNDAEYAKISANGGPVTEQNIFIHKWFRDVVDPGDWLLNNLSSIVSDANAQKETALSALRRIIFVGDARASAIHETIGSDINLWATSGNHSLDFSSVDLEVINSNIGSKSAICIIGSPFDTQIYDPKNYVTALNTMANEWFNRGCSVFYASITPVANDGYRGITNVAIHKYNMVIKDNLTTGIGYIDTYSAIYSTYKTTDGLYYDADTNKRIYSTITTQASKLSTGIGFTPGFSFSPTDFNPYIILYDRNNNPPYDKLSNIHVSGAIIEAGFRYDSFHNRTAKFDNPNLESQIQSLEKYNLPYGLYTVCRARSINESAEEMKYFQYPVYRHPPKLGVWLMLQLGNDYTTNNSIIDSYYTSLSKLGLLGKMGIICDRAYLKQFDWENFQDKFYLYLIDHVSSLSELSDVLTPELFNVD